MTGWQVKESAELTSDLPDSAIENSRKVAIYSEMAGVMRTGW
jgi:hypothetical protein